MSTLLSFNQIYAFDSNPALAKSFAANFSGELPVEPTHDLPSALKRGHVCITCTPATRFLVRRQDISPGTFIAAVGADDSHKQEIDPALMASAKVVADNLDQSSTIGDTHHAISAGLMRKENVYGELAEIVAGKKSGRTNSDEITVFDSTGIALEDAVAAVTVYEKARASKSSTEFDFAA